MNIEHDIPYGSDPVQRLDLYTPAKSQRAAILDIHGGGWWMGDKAKEAPMAQFLTQAGYLVAVPNYRLADGRNNLFPTQADDVSLALDWLRGQTSVPVGAFGASSGGNLAVEVAIRHGIPAASWSGLFDLEGFMRRHGETTPHRVVPGAQVASAGIDQGGPDPGYYKWLVLNLLGADLAKLHEATPMYRVTPQTGPMFLAGSLRELVPATDITTLATALVEANAPVETLVLAGSRHGEGYRADAADPTLEFLARNLAPV
jgi:acetyl esterase/lipase